MAEDQDTLRPATRGDTAPPRQRILLVTGMSGAGRSSALKVLEDIGYEAVDNLPLSLLGNVVEPGDLAGSLAIGIDIRTRDFGVEPFLTHIDALIARPGLDVQLLFLDCQDEVLRRRFTETRRRHPLAGDRPVMDGIMHERRLVHPLLGRADLVIDTSDLTLGQLQRIIAGNFNLDAKPALAIFVTSFSFRLGVPREADLVFDVRFLRNPHYVDKLRLLSGLDEPVRRYIADDPDFETFFESLTSLLAPLLPRYSAEGKSYLTIAIGCTGGRHRSVHIADLLAKWLAERGERVTVGHRDLPGHGPD